MSECKLKDKLISEAQAGWNKLDMIKRVCGSEFSYYDGYVDCGIIKEKRIAELEQENNILAQNLEDTEIVNKALEKENAELKGLKDVSTLIRANNDTVTTLMQLNNMIVSKNQQLTRVKELLKEFVQHYKAKTIYVENMQDLLEQSEQFLNSEVEK